MHWSKWLNSHWELRQAEETQPCKGSQVNTNNIQTKSRSWVTGDQCWLHGDGARVLENVSSDNRASWVTIQQAPSLYLCAFLIKSSSNYSKSQCIWSFWLWLCKMWSYVVQAGLTLQMSPRMPLNPWSSCFYLQVLMLWANTTMSNSNIYF